MECCFSMGIYSSIFEACCFAQIVFTSSYHSAMGQNQWAPTIYFDVRWCIRVLAYLHNENQKLLGFFRTYMFILLHIHRHTSALFGGEIIWNISRNSVPRSPGGWMFSRVAGCRLKPGSMTSSWSRFCHIKFEEWISTAIVMNSAWIVLVASTAWSCCTCSILFIYACRTVHPIPSVRRFIPPDTLPHMKYLPIYTPPIRENTYQEIHVMHLHISSNVFKLKKTNSALAPSPHPKHGKEACELSEIGLDDQNTSWQVTNACPSHLKVPKYFIINTQ